MGVTGYWTQGTGEGRDQQVEIWLAGKTLSKIDTEEGLNILLESSMR